MIPPPPNVLTCVYRDGAWVEGMPEERSTGNGGQRVRCEFAWFTDLPPDDPRQFTAFRFRMTERDGGTKEELEAHIMLAMAKAATRFTLSPSDIVWPSPMYPTDADGRGLSVMEVEYQERQRRERAA